MLFKKKLEGDVVTVLLHWRESESEIDIASGWIHRGYNSMFTLSSDKDQRKNSLSLSVNEPLLLNVPIIFLGAQSR